MQQQQPQLAAGRVNMTAVFSRADQKCRVHSGIRSQLTLGPKLASLQVILASKMT